MAKIRNSLGLIVLDATLDTFPTFGDYISFAEYKAKTGIDLDDLFGYDSDNATVYLKTITKLLAIRCVSMNGHHHVSMAKVISDTIDDTMVIKVLSNLDNGSADVSLSDLTVDVINGKVMAMDF